MYADVLGMDPAVSGDERLFVDPTVGGVHPTDLGMRKQAVYWTEQLQQVRFCVVVSGSVCVAEWVGGVRSRCASLL
jgi:hypothetical protein